MQAQNIDTGTMVVPISADNNSVTSFSFRFGDEPYDKVQTIFIVNQTIAFETQVQIR